jgi:hypothetical protein
MTKRIFMTDKAARLIAARDERKCTCDALPSRQAFQRYMRDAVRAGQPFAKAIRMGVQDQMGAGGPSTGGSPEKTPGPGYSGIQTSEEFQPNAQHNISPYSRASTTQQSLNMGQVWGAQEELPTEQTNVHGFALGNPSGPTTDRVVYTQIVRPSRRTMDAAQANIRAREEASRRGTATAASINAANRAAWGV